MTEIVNMIHRSINAAPNESWENILNEISIILSAYSNASRNIETRDNLVLKKFSIQHWAQKLANILLTRLETTKEEDYPILINCFIKLNISLTETQLKIMIAIIAKNTTDSSILNKLTFLVAQQGRVSLLSAHLITPELLKLSGPAVKAKIGPFKKSHCTFERWSKNSEFSNYKISGNNISFRGLELRPGDILMVSPTLETGGLFTVFSTPDSFSAHVAFIAVLNYSGKAFPSVVEIHEHGLRAVPLSTYFAGDFSTYIEVIRLNEINESHYDKINSFYFKNLPVCHGYSFHTDDRDDNHFTCTRVINELLAYLDLPLFKQTSIYQNEKLIRNLHHLNFKFDNILEPNDILINPRATFIGTIDNQNLSFEVSGRLAVNYYCHMLSTKTLDLKKLSLFYQILFYFTKVIQSGNVLGKIIGWIFGYNSKNFPKGSAELLSYFYIVDPQLTKMAKLILKETEQLIEEETHFSIYSFENRAEVVALLKKHSHLLNSSF